VTEIRFQHIVVSLAVSALLFALCFSAEAQQQKEIRKIAYLVAGSAASMSTNIDAFRRGLRDHGLIDRENLIIEYRHAEGIESRLPDLATELVRLKPNVMFTANTSAALALKNATTTIPIVVVLTADPVAIGLVKSLARPGGNVTGLTRLSNSPEIIGKRLEILKETFPRVKVVAVLGNPESASAPSVFKEMEAVGQTLRVHLQWVKIRRPNDFENAFSAIRKTRANALMVLSSSNMIIGEPQIVNFAITSRLPAMYFRPEAVDRGGLMYYGPNESSLFFRAATYIDKVVKGVNPADLPVEQPTKFDLAIILKTAKQIGLTIPPNVLARADRVIK